MAAALKVLLGCLLRWPVAVARLGMTATELTNADFEKFVSSSERVLVDFYDAGDAKWPADLRELEQALVTVRGYGHKAVTFAKVNAPKEEALAKRYVRNGRYPQLVWFAHGEPTQYHRSLRSAKSIADFVMALDRESMAVIASAEETRDYNRAVLVEGPRSGPLFKTVEAVALRHMDMVAFTLLPSDKATISWVVDGTPGAVYSGPHEVEAIDRWVKRQMPLKSEEIPTGEMATEDGVRVVVGKNFEDSVLQPDKDVMLLVYAPWCGYCKKLKPEWKKFAYSVANVPHLVVAQIDGDRNQSPLMQDFSWNAYPTIFFVRAGEKVPEIYSGNRTVESLLNFVKEHSSKPLQTLTEHNESGAVFDL